ncbi:MAG: hypothetical protein ACOX0H_03040 [Patescibacteria group bacterium]|jgi:hypothetical protein
MFDYLQQFNSLPKDLKDKVSSPQAMAALAEIENHYQVDLAMIVMKVMIKSLTIKDLPAIFVGEFSLSAPQAEALTKDLKEKIFKPVADYVGLGSETKELDLNKDINLLIKEAGLTIPSEFLIERLKKIIATYLKGVRSRIDTRGSLAKDIEIGGLGLSAEETDRILKVCDLQKFKDNENLRSFSVATPPGSRLDKIISSQEQAIHKPLAEYDFKKALASGEVKRISSPAGAGAAIAAAHSKGVGETSNQTQTPSQAIASTQASRQAPVSAPTQTATKPSSLESRGIVHKPESTSLFKKIFTEEQKQASPESVKFATAAPIPDIPAAALSSAQVATTTKSSVAPRRAPGTSVRPTASVASARIAANAQQTTTPQSQAEFLAKQKTAAMSRPRVEDVRAVPKVMGPIEELQFLDLVNFRRLGRTPEEITEKIFNKIKLLEKDGYDKMIAGIIAWKKSPVCLLYLKMVQEAVASGKTLKESVALRQEKNQDVLTMEEIEAIMNFNSKLVF